ncbi:membrane protein insertase YidC [Lentisalinibacter orientalis]|uniref:membrane protein insertase YidC n=1 Tax=Lentisalinibacter orientalis TaxID=2992241 RepID=UPI0038656D20
MENQRLFIWALFGLMAFMTWTAWQQDYAPRLVPADTSSQQAADRLPPDDALGTDLPDVGDVPTVDAGDGTAGPRPADSVAEPAETRVRVVTDVLDVLISSRGGDIVSAVTRRYPVEKDRPDQLVQVLNPSPNELAVFRTGLRTVSGDTNQPEPNHRAEFTAARSEYRLGDGEDALEVPLTWEREDGLSVTKIYRFERGSYIIPMEQRVTNGTGETWAAAPYGQIAHRMHAQERSMFDVATYSYDGPVLYNGDKYEKIKPDDLQDDGPVQARGENGWLAAIEHHFLSAIVPPSGQQYRYDFSARGDNFLASAIGPAYSFAPGETGSLELTLFVGPKIQDQLTQVAETLKLTVDYGFLTILSQPLFWLLDKVHDFVGNWGWSIIIVTLLIKLVFYKLTETSGRSMAKMRKLQPRLKAIQERYKDDRQKLSQAMMELYKREKVNPAAGCLPILVQMPFFLAFYWVLLESVEMRQAPFMLWIQDLSSRDPYFILPVLMGAAMFGQQKLNPAPPDPVQAKVMSILPIVFTVFFAFFPAGLVLYWLTNTLLSIAQQWQVNRVVEAEDRKTRQPKSKKKNGDEG